jgi:hypothetical protein
MQALTVETRVEMLPVHNQFRFFFTQKKKKKKKNYKINYTCHTVAIQKACARNSAAASAFSMISTNRFCCKLKAEKRCSASN